MDQASRNARYAGRRSGTGRRAAGLAGLLPAVLLLAAAPASAQVVADGTVGTSVAAAPDGVAIGGGTLLGGNLFHSFRSFSIPAGTAATFADPGRPVGHVIGRVTGGEVSRIDGTLRSAVPGAGLWLVNPAGIALGPGAAVDVPGALHLSTADEVRLADGTAFGAASPAGSRLSIAPPVAFGFLAPRPAALTVATRGLNAAPGAALTFAGGSVGFRNATVNGTGGRIDIVAAGGPGAVEIGAAGARPADGMALADVGLGSASFVGVRATAGHPGGSLAIRAGSLDVAELSFLFAENQGRVAPPSLDIAVTGDVRVALAGGISTGVFGQTSDLTGQAGPLSITARAMLFESGGSILSQNFSDLPGSDITLRAAETIRLTGDASLGSSAFAVTAFGTGPAGNLDIRAAALELTEASNITAAGSAFETGDAGNIAITVRRLSLSGGANIYGNTIRGGGDGGSITIDASESVRLSGAFRFTLPELGDVVFFSPSTITVGSDNGRAGTLRIRSPDVRLEGGQLLSSTVNGRGGDILVETQRLVLTDNGFEGAEISSGTNFAASPEGLPVPGLGSAGNVVVTAAESVTLRDGPLQGTLFGTDAPDTRTPSSINTVMRGTGQPGRVQVTTPTLSLAARTDISATAMGPGDGGSIVLTVPGTLSLSEDANVSASSVLPQSGAAGDILIRGGEVVLRSGGYVTSSTRGNGPGGRIDVAAGRLDISGTGTGDPAGSGIYSRTLGGAPAGSIALRAGSLSVAQGGAVSAESLGMGRSGDIVLAAEGALDLDGGRVTSRATMADGGTIRVTAGSLSVTGAGGIDTLSEGAGSAGDLSVAVGDVLRMSGGTMSTTAAAGSGGRMSLTAGGLIDMEGSSVVSSVAEGTGNGGDVAVGARHLVMQDSRIQANAAAGNGGNMSVRSDVLLRSPDSLLTASSQLGIAGSIEITAPDVDVSGSLAELPAVRFAAAGQPNLRCAARGLARLVEIGRGGVAQVPDQLQPVPFLAPEPSRPGPAPGIARLTDDAGCAGRGARP